MSDTLYTFSHQPVGGTVACDKLAKTFAVTKSAGRWPLVGVAVCLMHAAASWAATATLAPLSVPILQRYSNIITGADGNFWITGEATSRISKMDLAGNVTTYSMAGTSAYHAPADSMINGPDGNVWFGNWTGKTIGKVSPLGVVQEYDMSSHCLYVGDCWSFVMVVGSDGNIWAPHFSASKISKVTTAGSITSFAMPAGSMRPFKPLLGGDGNVWYGTDSFTPQIQKIDTAGNITAYPTTDYFTPWLWGADGNIWGFFQNYGNAALAGFGKVSTLGVVTKYTLPAGGYSWKLIKGTGNDMWFFDQGTRSIGKITTSGQITEYPLPSSEYGIGLDIALGPDGNVWYFSDETTFDPITDAFIPVTPRIGRVTPSGNVLEAALPASLAGPNKFVTGPDNKLWFSEWTGKLVRVDGLTPSTSFSGNTAASTGGSTGVATVQITGGNAGCDVSSSSFVPPAAVATPPAGVSFPHGVVRFATYGCGAGTTLTVTLTFPQALPAGTQFYKYGPATVGAASSWYVHPATIAGNTITYTVTDNGVGDSDPRSGFISDPGGPGVPGVPGAGGGVQGVPTLGQWAMVLLAGLMGFLGMTRARKGASA